MWYAWGNELQAIIVGNVSIADYKSVASNVTVGNMTAVGNVSIMTAVI